MAIVSAVFIPTAFMIGHSGPSLITLIIALIITGIASILSFVNLGRSKTTTQRLSRGLVSLAIPLLAAGTVLLSEQSLESPIEPIAYTVRAGNSASYASATTEQNPELLEVLRSIGARGNYAELALIYHPGDMAKPCKLSSSLACYKKNLEGHSITVSKQLSKHQTRLAIAHEYLHYAWQKNNLADDSILNSYLIDFYAKSPELQGRMSNYYVESGGLDTNEIFSHSCTEMPEQALGGYLYSKCSEFIDPSKITVGHQQLTKLSPSSN